MAGTVFRFRRFEVRNRDSALKVGTDAVLLGAAMTILPSDRTALDIGTGTGVIALMAAQRSLQYNRNRHRPGLSRGGLIQFLGFPLEGAPYFCLRPALGIQDRAEIRPDFLQSALLRLLP